MKNKNIEKRILKKFYKNEEQHYSQYKMTMGEFGNILDGLRADGILTGGIITRGDNGVEYICLKDMKITQRGIKYLKLLISTKKEVLLFAS